LELQIKSYSHISFYHFKIEKQIYFY
jgi:hypothetical protein